MDDFFVDVGCGLDMLLNAICITFQQMDAVGIENSVNQFESACTTTFEIMHDTIYNRPEDFIFGSFCNPSNMAPILDCENACIWFNNYGRCMEGMPQSGLEILLEEYCRHGACVASFSPTYLLPLWHCKKYEVPVGEEELSWTDTLKTVDVYVYKKFK